MRLTHLTEALQGFAGNKMIGVEQMGPGDGTVARSHL
jgi:hypothetical protein